MSERLPGQQQTARQAELDYQTDVIFGIFLADVDRFEDLSETDIDLLMRLLPEGPTQDELKEIIKNRIALGIGKASVANEVE